MAAGRASFVTQPPGSDGSAARLRAQIGGSTDFALSDDLRAAIRGNAAVTTDGGASAHADLSLTTGGGTGFGVAATAGPDGVAHEAISGNRSAMAAPCPGM